MVVPQSVSDLVHGADRHEGHGEPLGVRGTRNVGDQASGYL